MNKSNFNGAPDSIAFIKTYVTFFFFSRLKSITQLPRNLLSTKSQRRSSQSNFNCYDTSNCLRVNFTIVSPQLMSLPPHPKALWCRFETEYFAVTSVFSCFLISRRKKFLSYSIAHWIPLKVTRNEFLRCRELHTSRQRRSCKLLAVGLIVVVVKLRKSRWNFMFRWKNETPKMWMKTV